MIYNISITNYRDKIIALKRVQEIGQGGHDKKGLTENIKSRFQKIKKEPRNKVYAFKKRSVIGKFALVATPML